MAQVPIRERERTTKVDLKSSSKGALGARPSDTRVTPVRRDGQLPALPLFKRQRKVDQRHAERRDGGIVAIPYGAHGLQGRDGRMVAIRQGKHEVEDAKGKVRVKP